MAESTLSVYTQLGDSGFQRLVAAFYRRVTEDAILSVLYPKEDLPGAERRLRMFLIQFFGGPNQYSAERGHPRLRMRHMPFVIGQVEREHWLAAMMAAMKEAEIPEPAYTEMRDYFEKTATFLMNGPLSP